MNKPIGGRGKKAPYETTHVRVPVELKPQVEKLIEQYRENACIVPENVETELPNNKLIDYHEFFEFMIKRFIEEGMYIDKNDGFKLRLVSAKNVNEAYELAKNIVATRKTKKAVAACILSTLFGTSTDDPRLD